MTFLDDVEHLYFVAAAGHTHLTLILDVYRLVAHRANDFINARPGQFIRLGGAIQDFLIWRHYIRLALAAGRDLDFNRIPDYKKDAFASLLDALEILVEVGPHLEAWAFGLDVVQGLRSGPPSLTKVTIDHAYDDLKRLRYGDQWRDQSIMGSE
ncbi:hypothetical protein LTR62_000855 [Meristemomyces frigidus]|uniref:Uncharacterized protein n=1 Tax=Meristemomyces frigidus TaxID=1508187 RepID=A0AAN7TU77_9PEZI|nr:hypothetical protein LTR62_000855 [Meristemomyces frigidus]